MIKSIFFPIFSFSQKTIYKYVLNTIKLKCVKNFIFNDFVNDFIVAIVLINKLFFFKCSFSCQYLQCSVYGWHSKHGMCRKLRLPSSLMHSKHKIIYLLNFIQFGTWWQEILPLKIIPDFKGIFFGMMLVHLSHLRNECLLLITLDRNIVEQ